MHTHTHYAWRLFCYTTKGPTKYISIPHCLLHYIHPDTLYTALPYSVVAASFTTPCRKTCTWRFMGSCKFGYKSPNIGYNYLPMNLQVGP